MSKINKIENLFLSVGAMKAGTTWLYEQLKDHPEIYFTPRKEIHYLANTVGIENQTGHHRRLQQSKQFMKEKGIWHNEWEDPTILSDKEIVNHA